MHGLLLVLLSSCGGCLPTACPGLPSITSACGLYQLASGEERCGCPVVAEGRSLKETARILNVSRNTLRRRLRETGAWPMRTTAGSTVSAA